MCNFAPLDVCDQNLIGLPSSRGPHLAPASPKTLHLLTSAGITNVNSLLSLTTISSQHANSHPKKIKYNAINSSKQYFSAVSHVFPHERATFDTPSIRHRSRSRRDPPTTLTRTSSTKYDVLTTRSRYGRPRPSEAQPNARLDSLLPRVFKHALPQGGQGRPTSHVPVPNLPAHRGGHLELRLP